MTEIQKNWVRVGLMAFLVFAACFILTQTANAQGIYYGDTIPAGTRLDNDAILYGENVEINGDVVGDVFAIGRTVVISGTVDGSLYVVGEDVTLRDQVEGSMYSAAVIETLLPGSSINRNLYFAGLSLNTEQESSIGRDLYAFALGVQLKGETGRNVQGVIGPFEIFRLLYDFTNGRFQMPEFKLPDIKWPWSGVTPEIASHMGGSRVSAALLPARMLAPAGGGERLTIQGKSQFQVAAVDWQRVSDWLLDRLREFAVLIIIGLLSSWLIPYNLKRWATRVPVKPWLVALYGFAFIVLGFAAAFLITGLVIAITIGLGLLTLGNLAFLVGTMGLFATGLAFFVFYFVVFYLSKVVVALLIGRYILGWLAPGAAEHRFWPLLLGLVVYVLIVALPYVGWLLAFIAVLLGSGAIWLQYRHDWRNDGSEGDMVSGEVDPMDEAGAELQEGETLAQPAPTPEGADPASKEKATSRRKVKAESEAASSDELSPSGEAPAANTENAD